MPVLVQCSHCQSLCQLDERHLGAAVKCGKCCGVFTAQTAAPAPAAKPGGFWSKLLGRTSTAPVQATPETPTGDELSLELDGPAAGASGPSPATSSGPLPSTADNWVTLLPTGTLRLDIGAATSPGKVRERNEDSFLVQQLTWSNRDRRHDLALVVVADGLGGHEAGDQASGIVIRTIGGSLAGPLLELLTGQSDSAALAAAVDAAIRNANESVYRQGVADPACKGMGSTVAVVAIADGEVRIGHVGDCRVYHFHADQLRQVTKDQTLVARLVELGQISAAEALTHRARNEITQSVGTRPEVEPAAYELKLAVEDWLIVACDGLHAHVDEHKLAAALRESIPSATQVAHRLVELANQGGGSDNCTVVAVRCY